jgi:hypothetical protein
VLVIVTVSAQSQVRLISKKLLNRHKRKPCVNRASSYNLTVCIISGEESRTLIKTSVCWKVHFCLTICFCYAQISKSESLIRCYIQRIYPLTSLPSLTLLHSTRQSSLYCPVSTVIAGFMVLNRYAENGCRTACIAF